MSKFFLEDELRRLPPTIAKFFQDLWAPAALKYGLLSSSIGRPLTDWNNELSSLTIADFLEEFWPTVLEKPDGAILDFEIPQNMGPEKTHSQLH